MGMYDNVPKAEIFDKTNFLGEGRYITKITAAYGKEGRKNNFCKIELIILACLNDKCVHRIGEKVAVIFSKKNDYFDADLKKFCVALGAAPEDVDIEMCESVLPFWDTKMKEPPQSQVEGFPLEWHNDMRTYTDKKDGQDKTIIDVSPVSVPTVAVLEDLGIADQIEAEVLDFMRADEAAE